MCFDLYKWQSLFHFYSPWTTTADWNDLPEEFAECALPRVVPVSCLTNTFINLHEKISLCPSHAILSSAAESSHLQSSGWHAEEKVVLTQNYVRCCRWLQSAMTQITVAGVNLSFKCEHYGWFTLLLSNKPNKSLDNQSFTTFKLNKEAVKSRSAM